MALIFFMVIIINQFGTIIGPFIAFKRSSQFESCHFKDTNLNRLNHLANGQIIAKMTMVPLMVSEVGRYRLMLLCHIWLLNKAFFNLNRFTQVGEKVNFLVNNVEVQRKLLL